MSILKVARIGHPVVRETARDLTAAEIRSPGFQKLIDDMVETMHEYEGVGLAAPQVHVGLRLAVLEVPSYDERTEEAVPLLVLVNPRVTPLGAQKVVGAEGCLSIPGLRGSVPRYKKVRLQALDRHAEPYAVEAAGFFARVIQHECDHLAGEVYLDRMQGMRTLAFNEEMDRHKAERDEDETAE
jgi:peptide deformylase